MMNTETFASSRFGQLFIRTMASLMESRFRYRFFGPLKILHAAGLRPGQVEKCPGGQGRRLEHAARCRKRRCCTVVWRSSCLDACTGSGHPLAFLIIFNPKIEVQATDDASQYRVLPIPPLSLAIPLAG